MISTARATTESARRYMIQLCKHWGHKFEVVYDDTSGRIALPVGPLTMAADETGLTAAVARAFVVFAKDERATFRRELATALFTLPMLRAFLLNSPKALPAGESGYRSVQPDMETFAEFAWPCYCIVPGLRAACVAFLAEPVVRTAELELRTYWSGYREVRRDPKAQPVGCREGWERLLAQGIDRVAPADTHSSRS